MLLTELDFQYPPELIAVEPRRPTRVALTPAGQPPQETTVADLFARHFQKDDLLVINETKVIPARIFSQHDDEILFLKQISNLTWEVLFPARDYKIGAQLNLPGGIQATLTLKGLPQQLTLSEPLPQDYFDQHGEMALPPYLQEARKERHNRATDQHLYQTAWARQTGSVAAPTASLHIDHEQLQKIPNVAKITLHVGAGTFLPVKTPTLEAHQMHAEKVEIPLSVQRQIVNTKGRVWALGTTAARALESMDQLKLNNNSLTGETKLFIYPPYSFKYVDVLLTNFHQPRSTLLALVMAFAGMKPTQDTYRWAIARGFNLFSYGDLSAWIKP